MPLSHKPVQTLTEADLQRLISDKESEGKTIDYKSKLPGKDDTAKKEFLYDVSSFANTNGGYLVYGMEETNGIPTKLAGFSGINPEEEVQRLDHMTRDGIRPPIIGVHTVPVKLSDSNFAFVLHVPKSWNPPHQVTYQKAFRFYRRGSNGNYQMDVDELRSIFTLSEALGEKIQRFRMERVAKIASGEIPPVTERGARLITHILPLSAFTGLVSINLESLERNGTGLGNVIGGLNHSRYNADGFVAWANAGYIQIFRSGCVEAVHVFSSAGRPGTSGMQLASVSFETRVFHHINGSKQLLQSLGVEPPAAILLALTGLKGTRMVVPQDYSTSALDVFDRDPLLIPEILLETFAHDYRADARPLIDAVWNAAGWPGSPYYDEKGEWDPQRR